MLSESSSKVKCAYCFFLWIFRSAGILPAVFPDS
jgi:hypothetical protein